MMTIDDVRNFVVDCYEQTKRCLETSTLPIWKTREERNMLIEKAMSECMGVMLFAQKWLPFDDIDTIWNEKGENYRQKFYDLKELI